MSVEVEGRRVRLTSLDKPMWPAAGFTKGELVDYYARVAPALLRHLADRPLTLGRFPDGIDGPGFAQTECRGGPEWLRTHAVRLRSGEVRNYCLVNDLPSLLWVANLGTIELHPFLARAERLAEPTVVAFDLDPGPGAGLLECCRVAVRLRAALDEAGLRSYPKTTGSLGLHVYVPLNCPHGYRRTKAFAREVAARLAAEAPGRVTDRPARALRAGKVLVDWAQNDPGRSTVAAYSLRATDRPSASTPVSWDELERALGEERPELLAFGPAEVVRRVEGEGDLFRPVAELRQRLPTRAP